MRNIWVKIPPCQRRRRNTIYPQRQCLFSVMRRRHEEPCAVQSPGQERAHKLFVIGHQNMFLHHRMLPAKLIAYPSHTREELHHRRSL